MLSHPLHNGCIAAYISQWIHSDVNFENQNKPEITKHILVYEINILYHNRKLYILQ